MKFLRIILILLSFSYVSCSQTKDNLNQAKLLLNRAQPLMYKSDDSTNRYKSKNEAINLLKKSIELDSTRFLGYQMLIDIYMTVGKQDSSILVCTRWLNSHINDYDIIFKRGLFYYRLNQFDLAKYDFEKVKNQLLFKNKSLNLNSDTLKTKIPTLINVAITFLIIGEQKNGIDLLDLLIKKFPNDERLITARKEYFLKDRDTIIHQLTGF